MIAKITPILKEEAEFKFLIRFREESIGISGFFPILPSIKAVTTRGFALAVIS